MATDFFIDPGVTGLTLRLELNEALGELSSGLRASKFDATRDPLPTDNSPYNVGSRWVRTDTGHEWVCTSVDGGNANWVLTTAVGGAGGAAGAAGSVQIAGSGGALAADTGLTFSTTAKTLNIPLVGDKIHAAGNIVGAWAPPLNGAGTITATVTGDLTLNTPTGLTLPSDREIYLKLLLSASAHRTVTFNIGSGGTQYGVLHRPPMRALMANTTTEIVLRWQGDGSSSGKWYLVGSPIGLVPITFAVPGVPPVNTSLWEMYVHNMEYSAPALYVPYRLDDIGSTSCTVAPTSSTAFSIQRSVGGGAWSQIGTATFAAGVSTYVTWDFGAQIWTLSHGDRLRVLSPANLNGLQNLSFIMACAG